MGKNNAELTSIISFKEDDRWYLKLIYTYEDKKGKHTVVIPKSRGAICSGVCSVCS